jgi:hypothetical protein
LTHVFAPGQDSLVPRTLSRFLSQGLVVLALVVGIRPISLSSQEDQTLPAVRLAAPQTAPGGETFVTMMLDNLPTQRVQSIRSEVEFHTGQLTYVAARLAFAGDLAEAALDIVPQKVAEEPGTTERKLGDRMRLVITVTGKKVIPNGPVLEMRFKVAPGLDGVNVKLDQKTTATSPEGTAVANLATPAGEIQVTTEGKPPVPIVYGCFFYMH